jgi:hypothetical protein
MAGPEGGTRRSDFSVADAAPVRCCVRDRLAVNPATLCNSESAVRFGERHARDMPAARWYLVFLGAARRRHDRYRRSVRTARSLPQNQVISAHTVTRSERS